MNKEFLIPNIVLVVGVLALLSGLSALNSTLFAGLYMIVGALAYKSIKTRINDPEKDTVTRKVMEGLGIALMVTSVLLTNREVLVSDPFSNLVIPIVVILVYGKIFLQQSLLGRFYN